MFRTVLEMVMMTTMSNLTGIWAGMRTVKYFDGKTYAWVGLSRQKSIFDMVSSFSSFPLQCTLIKHLNDEEDSICLFHHQSAVKLLGT